MTTVFAKARVTNVERWKEAFMRGEEARRAVGLTVTSVYRGAEEGTVIVVMDAPDPDAVFQLYNLPEQRERMAQAGGVGAPEIWIGAEDIEVAVPDGKAGGGPIL